MDVLWTGTLLPEVMQVDSFDEAFDAVHGFGKSNLCVRSRFWYEVGQPAGNGGDTMARDAEPRCTLCGRAGHTSDTCNMPEGVLARGGKLAPRVRMTPRQRYSEPGKKQAQRIADVLREIRGGDR